MSLVRSVLARPKATSGPGMWSMVQHAPVGGGLSKQPQKLMAEAQQLFHTNAWVAQVERTISGRFSRVPWHLEDADGDTVDDSTGPLFKQAQRLIEHPAERMTRRGLWSLTLRHMGLCGNAFWFLDQRDLRAGVPLSILYINPARMTPAEDDAGNLLGWVLDAPSNPVSGKPGRPGVPLQLDEVIHFPLDEPDWGHFGVGVAESANAKAELSRLSDRHIAQTLATGGRLAGMLAPKERDGINPDQWEAIVRGWRQIADDPEAAKRLHIVKGPVDFTATASKPAEMQLAEIAVMSRDDILAAWGVPGSQIGIMASRGLNSGETVKYEEAALWQGAIEPRGEVFREKVQFELLERFSALGADIRLVIDFPSYDDQAPLFVNAEKARWVPLTNDERRAIVGLDPLEDEEVGGAIFIAQQMVPLERDEEPTVEEAPPPDVAPLPSEQEQGEQPTDDTIAVGEAKASLDDDLRAMRERIVGEVTPEMQKRLLAVLADMREDITSRVERHAAHLKANPADSSVWWDEQRWRRELADALTPASQMVSEVATAQAARFRASAASKADEWIGRVTEYVRRTALRRVDGILATTRKAIQKALSDGTRAGLPANELATAVRESAGLDEYRAELIARTEVMSAYNDASLRTFREFGAERVIADDGDKDDECAARNGQEYSLAEAESIGDHPNGTLTWIPVA